MQFGNLKDHLEASAKKKADEVTSNAKKSVQARVSKFKGEGTQQKYKPEDNTYRDLYNEPDQQRADRQKTKSFTYVYWMTAATFFGVQVAFWLLAGTLMSIFHNFGTAVVHYSILGSTEYLMMLSPHKGLMWGMNILLAILLTAFAYYWLWRNWKVQNLLNDTSDLNQYHDNARLTQPEEMIRDYDVVPDSGAHSKNVDVSSILGHMMIDNQGVNPVKIPKRYEKDVKDPKTGEVIHAAKSLIKDANGNIQYETVPMFDKKFANTLFDSAMLPSIKTPTGKRVRQWYNPKKLDYNTRRMFGKQNYDTLADLINNDWYIPDYEVQRPGGVYIVDSQPNNTMVCQHC